MIVRCWFCIFYEAAKPQVELRNQHLTILVVVTTDPLHTNDLLSPLTISQFGVENYVAMVTATKCMFSRVYDSSI